MVGIISLYNPAKDPVKKLKCRMAGKQVLADTLTIYVFEMCIVCVACIACTADSIQTMAMILLCDLNEYS